LASLDLTGTVKSLQVERARILQEITKLDKAIGAIRELAGAEASPNGGPKKRTMSAAARRKIANAQKLRWAKFREQKKAKT